MVTSGEEQRRHPRIETQQTVWVEGQNLRVAGEARNISRGGMFVVAQAGAPALGATVQIRFDDPHEGKVAVAMQVVWRTGPAGNTQLGLSALDEAGLTTLARVVSHYESGSAA